MVLDSFNLTGKVALVTGAARGLGQGMAVGFAEAGADVAILDVNAATETQSYVLALGRNSLALREDLREISANRSTELIDACVKSLGRLDILLNAAGIIHRAPTAEISEERRHSVLTLNLP